MYLVVWVGSNNPIAAWVELDWVGDFMGYVGLGSQKWTHRHL